MTALLWTITALWLAFLASLAIWAPVWCLLVFGVSLIGSGVAICIAASRSPILADLPVLTEALQLGGSK